MKFFVTCARGTEGAVRRELVSLRIRAPRGHPGGVSFDGSWEQAMSVCLHSRVAVRVLGEVGAFEARDAAALYAGVRAIDLSAYLSPDSTLAVEAAVSDSAEIRHSGFAALKVKDAVVDAIRDRAGRRPDVSPDDPDVALFLHLRGKDARLHVDLAGQPLHRRGYRAATVEAPLKETLAAAVLALGHVDPALAFVDPMTGSGTLAIEHALAARAMAPGRNRRFGFERWHDQRPFSAWPQLKQDARTRELPRAPAPIVAGDIAPDAIRAARRNAEAAGVAGDIEFRVAPVSSLAPPTGGLAGAIVVNPPYGARLGASAAELDAAYRDLASAFARARGWRLVVLSGNPLLARAIGGRPAVSHRLWNGPLEARLLVWQPRA